MPRLDSHQHFWRYNREGYAWITPEKSVLQRDYLPGDLAPSLAAIGYDGTVVVQARQSLEETRWLLELADAHPFIKGVVGWVDLCSAGVRQQLEQVGRHPKLVGVRHVVHDEPDIDFMRRPEFRSGLSQLQDYGLTYDLLLFVQHLPVALKLVTEFPAQPFVLDHIAKPGIQRREFSPWERDLKALARLPNVYCKLSGLITEANWSQWRPSDFDAYLSTVFEAFGPDRLMIGSDWPVCLLAGSYEATMQVVIDFVAQFPATVRNGILGENCARFYGLN